MTEIATIARPYARAAFEHAQASGKLDQWSEQLQLLSSVVQDAGMTAFLDSPNADSETKCQTVSDVCGEQLGEDGRNFVGLLASNQRMAALPTIAAEFEELKAEAEGTVEAQVVTARKLTKEQEKQLTIALKKRLKRDVVLNCTIDESLIGGAVVRAGDLVIDGSAKGRLEQLAVVMSH